MLLRLLFLCAACAALLVGCGDSEEGSPARSSSDFVDSIGVNVHMSYSDTAYGDAERVQSALRSLGIRHVRDGVVRDSRPLWDSLKAMRSEGIRSTLVIGDPDGRFGSGTLDEQLATLAEELGGDVGAIESPNEYDSTGPDFASKLRDYQQQLASGVERHPELKDRPIVGPSFINEGSYEELGPLEGIDFGNMHPYPGGQPPEEGLQDNLALAREVSGDRPVYATETGYHNAVNAKGEGVQPGVSEQTAAVYLPRLYLEYFKEGVARTFAYELLDQKPDESRRNAEMNFGLLRSDFEEKPAFGAMQNLIALLDDKGKPNGDGRLNYSLVNDEGVHTLLLRKSNGRFYLAVWRADAGAETRPRSVEVSFGDSMRRIAAYRPSRSPDAVYERRGASTVRADLGADAWVFEVTPDE